MHPVLFKAGHISVYSYGLMIALGFSVALLLLILRRREAGLCRDELVDLGICILLGGIIGARLLHVAVNFDYYRYAPLEIIMIQRGGLAYQGGLAGGLLAAYLYLRKKQISFLKTADFVLPYAALAQSLGRLGCFLNGCCYGVRTASFWGVKFPALSYYVHPTQLYYSLSLIVIFILLNLIYSRKKFNGQILCLYFLFYGLMRLSIDFLRGDLKAVFFGFSLTQLIATGMAVLALAFYAYLYVLWRKRPLK